ncbi:hypothetical protein N9X53_08225 [Mariniblastus sp.]|nr:hypothetical protein [Mariniblastus sp.]MDC3256394.1 hypothetical protein [bacterium]
MGDTYPTLRSDDWSVQSWDLRGHPTTVLQLEPFRLSWIATRLVTFVHVIRRTPDDYQSVLDDYNALRKYAGKHKRSFLPFAFQCAYALLPIYVGRQFSESLIADIHNQYKKRWCILHVPSLFDTDTAELHTLKAKSYWGCIYRPFIDETIAEIAACPETAA